ncbi:cation transporter [Vibrio sp. FNV 38]|nr:cation transporter [Vibrio sp. FNV 38]
MFSDKRLMTSVVTIVADVFLTLFRVALAYMTGSSALMADAYHSVTDLSVSIIFLVCMLIKVWQDKTGNKKRIEFAKKFESGTVILAAIIILCVPYKVITETSRYSTSSIENVWVGIIGVIFIIVSVFAIAKLKTYVGKKTGSLALEADGYHSMVDLFTSVAVLFSLIGLLIGIDLDGIVAVIIAILIAVSGLELLMSGIKSLSNHKEIEQYSLFEVIQSTLKNRFKHKMVHQPFIEVGRYLYKVKLRAVFIVVLGYLGSGFTQVQLGQQGIIQLFERAVFYKETPGLAYSLPWPFGHVLVVSADDVRTVTVGSEASEYTRRNGRRMWFEINANRASRDDTTYIQTGDENLVYVQLEVHYSLTEAARSHFVYDDIDGIVARVSETNLWRITASLQYNELLSSTYTHFSNEIEQQIAEDLKRHQIPVKLHGILVQNIQPPASLVSVYRDVVNAHQESENLVNQAIALSYEMLPLARSESINKLGQIQANAISRRESATGDSTRFSLQSNQFSHNEDAFGFEKYMTSMTNALSGKELIIVDPRFDKHDYRVWSQNSQQRIFLQQRDLQQKQLEQGGS